MHVGGDGLARAGLAHVLDAGDEVAHLAGAQALDRHVVGRADAHLVGLVHLAGLHEAKLAVRLQPSVHHPDRADHPAVLVEEAVEDEPPQRAVGIAHGRRHPLDHGVEKLGHPLTGLGAEAEDLVGRDAHDALDLGGVPVGIGGRQIDLVQRRHDLQIVVQGQVRVGQGLGLDPLGRVDQQDHALAGGQRSRTPRSRSRRAPACR